jgi:hypothetical protein
LPLAIISTVVVIGGLAVHAYFDTRKRLSPIAHVAQDEVCNPTSQEQDLLMAELRKSDEDLRTENRKLQDQVYALQTKATTAELALHSEREQANSQLEMSGKIWELKSEARAIRRRWTGSYFEHRPLDKGCWNEKTAVGYGNSHWPPPYLDRALAWFDGFWSLWLRLAPGQSPDQNFMKSLDFDGVVEVLDIAERRSRGIVTAELPNASPLVDITRYGSGAGPNGFTGEGFFLRNERDKAALDVQIDPVKLGCYLLTFMGPKRLTDKEEFWRIDIENTTSQGHCAGDLFKSIREFQRCADDWALKVPISIVYRDYKNNWYKTLCEIEPDPMARESEFIRTRFVSHGLTEPR